MSNPAAFDRCAKDERRLRRALQALGTQLLDEEPPGEGITPLYLGVATADAVIEEIVPPAVLPTPVDVPYVDVNPCVGLLGEGVDASVTIRVYLPWIDHLTAFADRIHPGVKEDDVIAFAYAAGGIPVCVSDYLAGEVDDHLVLASDDGDTPGVLADVLIAGNGVTLTADGDTLVVAAKAENPGTSIDTLGPVDESDEPIEGTETAATDTWTANGTDGLALWQTVRVVYNYSGDGKLYEFRRKLTFDRWGRLYSVSAEKPIEVEAPEAH